MFDVKALEYDEVLLRVSKFAISDKAKAQIIKLVPDIDYNHIKNMLEETEEARKLVISYETIPLNAILVTDEIIKRIELKASLSISDFLAILDLLSETNNILSYYKNIIVNKENIEYLNCYFSLLNPLKNLTNEMNSIMSMDGVIYDTASAELNQIRKKLCTLEMQVRAKMQELLQTKAKMLNENLIVIRNDRMCLCVKNEYKNTFKGVIHDESASKSTVYIEPYSALEISNKIVGVKEEEKLEISRILSALKEKVCLYKDEIKNNYLSLINLDIIFAKAKYAIKNECFKPIINQNYELKLFSARHPLISIEKCVAIDVIFNDNCDAIIITGPNTGGKTVTLKTTGLLAMMMQTGMLIPAKEGSTLPIFDNIFADIGDMQSIAQSLSSFSAHMKKVIDILDNLTPNSLVLLDELGSGTDPKEGSNLAISIVEYILKYKTKVIVTTHYADLKAFAYGKDNIINASVEFNTETLKPTYKLLLGIPGRSNALIIASKLGLNEQIIKRAIKLNEENHNDLSIMLAKLDEQNSELQKIIKLQEEKNEELEERLLNVRKKEEKLDLEYQNYSNKAQQEAQRIINKAKEDAEVLIDELNKMKENNDFKEHELAQIKHKIRQLDTKDDITSIDYDFNVGDYVFVKSWGQNGRISRINKEKYEVKIGNFLIEFTKRELGLAKAVKETKNEVKKHTKVVDPNKKMGKLECDLRGFRYEEVAHELDLFIDQAYLNGFSQVYVIHGFGTGAVRKACYEFFKKCPHIKNTRFGGEGEGLNGVTVVYLK